MSDVDGGLASGRAAVDDMIAAAERAADRWVTPGAPGKWSPSQIIEHVARALDESAKTVDGTPTSFPVLPSFVRPVVRGLFFKRVLRNEAFPKGKTNKAMNPASGPATVAEGRRRLEEAFARFERSCQAKPAGARIVSSLFGNISLDDWARFQALHVRHHVKQLHGGAD
jgi:hypothetical protein